MKSQVSMTRKKEEIILRGKEENVGGKKVERGDYQNLLIFSEEITRILSGKGGRNRIGDEFEVGVKDGEKATRAADLQVRLWQQ